MPGKKRHEEEEEPENHERWLVTYADMLTLLMVLFIVMFAMSTVDEKKYNALRSGLSDGFGQTTSYMKGSSSILDEDGSSVMSGLTSQTFSKVAPTQDTIVPAASAAGPRKRYDQARAELDTLEKIRRRIQGVLRRQGLARDVETTIDDRGLVVSLVSRHVVFPNDVATLSPRGERVVDVLSPVLRGIPNDLRIDGHTNQVKVHPAFYATDWDLSAARAVTVLRRLNEVGGVPDHRLSMSAFGHDRPLRDPSLPGSQAVNKRVDIIVLSDLDQPTRDLVEQLANPGSSSDGTTTERSMQR